MYYILCFIFGTIIGVFLAALAAAAAKGDGDNH